MSTDMAALARRKDPRLIRLAALKPYQALSPESRKMVRAVILEGSDPEMAGCGPNWRRIWDSKPVIDCLKAYGWVQPAKVRPTVQPYQPAEPLPEVPELPCGYCGEIGRHTSRHNQHLVCHACLCRRSNILHLAPPRPEKCWECGAEAQPTWDGRWLCPSHFSAAASSQAQRSAEIVAARNVLANQGRDINTCDLAAQRGMDQDNDYSRSVRIWEQQAREAADQHEQDRADRSRLADELNRQRAEYISRHGMLAPHDKF